LDNKLTVHRLHDKFMHSTLFVGGKERLQIPARVKGSPETPGIKAAVVPINLCTAATTMRTAVLLVFLATAALAAANPSPSQESRIIGKSFLQRSKYYTYYIHTYYTYYTGSFYTVITCCLKITSTALHIVLQLITNR
jgi:hypothetical protein